MVGLRYFPSVAFFICLLRTIPTFFPLNSIWFIVIFPHAWTSQMMCFNFKHSCMYNFLLVSDDGLAFAHSRVEKPSSVPLAEQQYSSAWQRASFSEDWTRGKLSQTFPFCVFVWKERRGYTNEQRPIRNALLISLSAVPVLLLILWFAWMHHCDWYFVSSN